MEFQLQPYQGMQSRYRCPGCNHRTKTFSRYIYVETGEQVAPHVGRCGRQDKCGYHLKPGEYLREAGSMQWRRTYRKPVSSKRKAKTKSPIPKYFINPDYVNDSFVNYDQNNFVSYLINRFGLDIADELVGKYRIGTSNYWPGATIFWQLDALGNVRTGKIMLYNKQTGKRVKEPYNHITWAHTQLLKLMEEDFNFNLVQCLFGEHLLITSPFKPVAVVESEKTAIIASAVMPAFIWLACGSLDGLNADKCKVLQGRKVMLFPDVNASNKWKLKALELQRAIPGTIFSVSTELEQLADDDAKKHGIDLGDVL